MRKFLSVLLSIIMVVTSCVCAFTVFAEEPCVDHVVTSWSNVEENGLANKKSHYGECTECGETVKKAHSFVKGDTVAPTCTKDGYTVYICSCCGYSEKRDTVYSKGHRIVSTTWKYNIETNRYEKTFECANGCEKEPPVTGSVGNSNYCPKCKKYMVTEKTVYDATCEKVSCTEYICTSPEHIKLYKKDNKIEESIVITEVVYREYGKETIDHEYEATVTLAKCEERGFTRHVCVMCSDTYDDTFVPAMGHKLNKSGEETTYTFKEDGSCEISGTCSVCGDSKSISKPYATPDECASCKKNIIQKIVAFPKNCEESITIRTNCVAGCKTQEIIAVPLGHEYKTATYEYHDNGELKSATVDCYNCGKNQPTNDDKYKDANTCSICSALIEKRHIVAPTCEETGYTKVTCPNCGVYTESTERKRSHDASEAEWEFDQASGVYTFRANCTKPGCGGYTFQAPIGINGVCARCGRDKLIKQKVYYSNCFLNGYTEALCGYCGNGSYYTGEDIQKVLSHKFVSAVTEPDCENYGATKNTCKGCYYTCETDVVEPLGHDGEISKVVFNQETQIKTITVWCERCSDDKGAEVSYDESFKRSEIKCPKCGEYEITSKSFIKPSCFNMISGHTKITCGKCGELEPTDIILPVHQYGKWVVTLPPSCIEEGIKERQCSVCKSVEIDTIPANQTTDEDGKIVPIHEYIVMVAEIPATCTEPGKSAEMYCRLCGDYKYSEVIKPLGHQLEVGSKNENFCDRCDSYVIGAGSGAVACSCICHNNDGLAKFFFKMIMFFCNIFGINQVCKCGQIHIVE